MSAPDQAIVSGMDDMALGYRVGLPSPDERV
jgi:hypothetical protein